MPKIMKVLGLSLALFNLCSGFVQHNAASSRTDMALDASKMDESRRQLLSQTLAIGAMAVLPTVSQAAESKVCDLGNFAFLIWFRD